MGRRSLAETPSPQRKLGVSSGLNARRQTAYDERAAGGPIEGKQLVDDWR